MSARAGNVLRGVSEGWTTRVQSYGEIVLRRLASIVAVVLITSFVIYSALYLAPGSVLNTLSGGRELGPAARAALTRQYQLDKPYLQRYVDWLGGALHGDFGTSVVQQGQSVGSLIAPRLATTALLVGMSALLIIVVGTLAGTVAGLSRGKLGLIVTATTTVGIAVPSFVAAVVLITVFSVDLGWFPAFGSGSGFGDRVWHLVLPAIALAVANVAYVARISETAIAQEAAGEQIQTARSRGIPERLIIRRHILRNAAIPISTTAGLITAYLVVGTAVVETAFGVNGIGSLLVQSVQQNDFPVVQAISLIVVVVFVAINLVVDILYARLDPRVELR